jgi:hypothetical protein
MSDSRVAGGMERLPWLSDEPVRVTAPSTGRGWDVTGWAVSAILIVAGFSFWLGSQRPVHDEGRQGSGAVPSATIEVPEPRPAAPAEVRLAPQPQVAPVSEPQVRVVRAPEVRMVSVPGAGADTKATPEPRAGFEPAAIAGKPVASVTPPPPKVAAPLALKPWPPRVVAGASGRLVQIGAYGSRIQAKRGWVAMAREYPALKRLPAVVAVTRNSRGRLFYRFQIGTTSHAHSEVLCQRMQRIDLSCAVVGLPWKPKVER